MEEDLTIKEKMDKILEALEQKEQKKFKMPWGVRLGQGKLKKEYAIVQLVMTNGNVKFFIKKIEDDTVKIGEKFYDASAGNILKFKKKPLLIIPEWNMKPFSPAENFTDAENKGTLTAAEKLILTKMKQEVIKPKMSLNFKTIIIIIAVLGGAYYLLSYLKVI